MMNSTVDEFGENPFRSSGGGSGDLFFDDPQPTTTATGSSFGGNLQPQQHQQPMSFQQQPMPLASDPFAPQPPMSNFPPPSGPMQQMSPPRAGNTQPQPQQGAPTTMWGNCMTFLTLESYKVYFDIDAEDIATRVKAVMMDFYKPEHFRNNVLGVQKTDSFKGPDLYGPFWITMTLIFLIGVTSNVHDYMHKSDVEEFDYDINHLLHAASVLCAFAFGLPVLFWITTQCLTIQALLLVEWVCLYGYSLVPFLPAVILCIIPFGIVSWILLSMATVVSCSLVIRNVAVPMLSSDVGQAKAPPVLLAIMGSHIIFFLFLKFSFYHHTASKK